MHHIGLEKREVGTDYSVGGGGIQDNTSQGPTWVYEIPKIPTNQKIIISL